MATGRIGVTPTLRTRWSKAPAGGTTSLSGLDDNSVSLVYDVGYEGVYRNGVLLSRGNDYTATDGTTVTLIDATIAGDIIEIFANELIPLSDAISKGQYTAKGALLSATAASTPGVLTVGSNDQVLTADSTASTGLKWATPSSGGMTLLNSGNTSLAGAQTITISSISGSYKHLYIVGMGIRTTNSYGANLWMRINGDTGSNYKTSRYQVVNNTIGGEGTVSPATAWFLVEINNGTAYNAVSFFETNIPLYSDTTQYKKATTFSGVTAGGDIIQSQMSHSFNSTSAITSLEFYSSNSSTGNFLGDSAVYVYGVN